MPEKFEYFPKSAEELSGKMIERLKRENVGREGETKKEKIMPEQVQPGALELSDLVVEKEDLLQAIGASEKLLKEKEKGEEAILSQDEIIEALDEIENFDARSFGQRLDSAQSIQNSIEENKKQLLEVKERIGELANKPEITKAYQKHLQEKIKTIHFARQVKGLQLLSEKINLSETKLLAHRNDEDLKLTKADKKVLEKNEIIRQKAGEKAEGFMNNPEVYYEVNRRELLNYRRQLLKDGFVETPSVKKEIAEIFGHLELGIPVFLRGHLGAGKTEILLHTARKYYGVEPEFISGSEEATKYDIYGRTQIGARGEEDKIKEFKLRLDEFKTMCPEIKGKELKAVEKQYYDEIVVKGQTTSFFQYGPLVRAMKEGKPVLIDEIDGIPHSILMRINHVLTRKAGDIVKIQENGGEEIKIKEGFCVMATGNIKSVKYKREELDAAFLSRWWSSEIKYLPPDETLKILTASLIDKRGTLELKDKEDLEGIKRLTQAAEEIQKIFSGEKTDVFGEGGDAARGISASLEKSVLSMRDLWNIVKPWKARHFDKPLDEYIYIEFIKKATVPKDQIYLTQLFCRFGFFKDWDAEQFGIAGLDKKKLDAFKAKKSK
jgi:MoxR-like ATPase